jgi:hypothetical protein
VSVAEPETLAPAALPALRLLPAPVSAPPYDDELPQGAPLRVLTGAAVPAAPSSGGPPEQAAAPLRMLPDPPVGADDHADAEPARTPLSQLPPPRPFAHALVQRLLEVMAGLRPIGQLQPDTSLELYDQLAEGLTGRARATGARPTRRDVRSLHVQARADGVAEVCATVRRGGRVQALAFRLEGRSGAWRCTELLGV